MAQVVQEAMVTVAQLPAQLSATGPTTFPPASTSEVAGDGTSRPPSPLVVPMLRPGGSQRHSRARAVQ
eukprot:3008862-Prorocentrum_lima.AAC.1